MLADVLCSYHCGALVMYVHVSICLAGAAVETSGAESTSRLPTSLDLGCEWTETTARIEAILSLSGLRGQPAMALKVDLTDTTLTVTAFGMQVRASPQISRCFT